MTTLLQYTKSIAQFSDNYLGTQQSTITPMQGASADLYAGGPRLKWTPERLVMRLEIILPPGARDPIVARLGG